MENYSNPLRRSKEESGGCRYLWRIGRFFWDKPILVSAGFFHCRITWWISRYTGIYIVVGDHSAGAIIHPNISFEIPF